MLTKPKENNGQPSKPIQLMIGLLILKHIRNIWNDIPYLNL